jgi:hypothetical protein
VTLETSLKAALKAALKSARKARKHSKKQDDATRQAREGSNSARHEGFKGRTRQAKRITSRKTKLHREAKKATLLGKLHEILF